MMSKDIISNSSTQISCENEIECSKPSLRSCHHCSKRLCLDHMNEHNDLNMVRVEELSDEMNKLTDLISNLNTEKSLEDARYKLNRWKKENFDLIERIYDDHSEAIHRLENELNDRLNIFKGSLESTITNSKSQLSYFKKINQTTQQELALIEYTLHQLRQCLQSVQCEITVETEDIPFENYLRINNVFSYDRVLLDNNTIQPYRKLSVENMKEFVSSKNNQTILWLDHQRQLHFIDQNFQSYVLTLPDMISNPQIPKTDNDIIDIKWCLFAEVFLILFPRYLYAFNPKTYQFIPTTLERYKNYPLRCISCLNETAIFISYSIPGICIEQWTYSFSNEFSMNGCLKHWDNLTKDKNEWVCSMNTNSALQVGLLIRRGETIYRRFELRDERLRFLKIISLDYVNAIYPFRSHHWFMKSSSDKYYIYSNEKNECRLSRFDFPFGVEEFGANTIVIGNKQNELIFRDI